MSSSGSWLLAPGFFLHDTNGRLTARPGSDGTTYLNYDYAGRVTSMTLGAGLTITYALDGDGRAQGETRGGKNHYYLLDGKNVLKEWGTQTVTVTSSSGIPAGNVALRPRDLVRLATATGASVTVSITQEIIDYTHGLGLISDRTTISRWYRWDGIGSLRNLENASGSIVASTVFDAYGLQQNSTTLMSAYGFIGEQGVRGEKGLAPGTLVPQNMRARMYDPLTGRFTSRDPIWDKNLYQYGNGNPWSFTDAGGMQAESTAQFKAEIAPLERQIFSGALSEIRESGVDPNSPQGRAQIRRFRESEAAPWNDRDPASSDEFNWHNHYFTALNKKHMLPVEAAAYADRMLADSIAGETSYERTLRQQHERSRAARAAHLSNQSSDLPTINILLVPENTGQPADDGALHRIARWLESLHIEERVGRRVVSWFQPTFKPGTPTFGSDARQARELDADVGIPGGSSAEGLGNVGKPLNQFLWYAVGTVVITLATTGFGGEPERPSYRVSRPRPYIFTGGDEIVVEEFERFVPAWEGYTDVVAHGSSRFPDRVVLGPEGSGNTISISEFARQLRERGYAGGKIRLFVCRSASTKVARGLSLRLRTTVVAPTENITTRILTHEGLYLHGGEWRRFVWGLPWGTFKK